ncbi:hypothetical protein, partial [Corynebacterium variabile]|uniref:hypothetical protein n=1 Tax=Corynebacterium variabile TaxID=1727 RepID=UPI003F96785E
GEHSPVLAGEGDALAVDDRLGVIHVDGDVLPADAGPDAGDIAPVPGVACRVDGLVVGVIAAAAASGDAALPLVKEGADAASVLSSSLPQASSAVMTSAAVPTVAARARTLRERRDRVMAGMWLSCPLTRFQRPGLSRSG